MAEETGAEEANHRRDGCAQAAGDLERPPDAERNRATEGGADASGDDLPGWSTTALPAEPAGGAAGRLGRATFATAGGAFTTIPFLLVEKKGHGMVAVQDPMLMTRVTMMVIHRQLWNQNHPRRKRRK